jgi:putative redox protein
MAKEVEVQATLIGPMAWSIVSGRGGQRVVVDVPSDEGGENTGPTPMELLLMSQAGCTGMDVISILRKQRQQVTGYEIRVHGIRADQHPKVYVDIEVEHVVTGHHIDPGALKRAIELSETKYCSVSGTLAGTAKITTSYRIIEAEDDKHPRASRGTL